MEYFIKASAILTIFYLLYKLFLQKETFFQSNRVFLLTGLIAALTIPLIVVPIYSDQTITTFQTYGNTNIKNTIEVEKSIDWMQATMYIYITGVIFFGSKFLLALFSLGRLIFFSPKEKINGHIYLESNKELSPFSFFNYIVYDDSSFKKDELNQILIHERAHADQKHSMDVLLAQIFSIIFWFNPISWLYKKALKQNLEFIADAVSLDKTTCKKQYQKLLLKTSVNNYQLALTNNFYNSLIKKRIIMLQKNRSNKSNQWKLCLIIPLLVAFVFAFNTEITAQNSQDKNTKSQVKPQTKKQSINPPIFQNNKIIFNGEEMKNPLIIIDGKESSMNPVDLDTNNFESLELIKGDKATNKYGEKGKNGVVLITTKGTHKKTKNLDKNINPLQRIASMQEKNTVYMVDGVESSKKVVLKLNGDNLANIHIIKGELATKKYGDKGKNGAVEITTKK